MSKDKAVDELIEQLGLDKEVEEQRFPYDDKWTDETLSQLSQEYDIYVERWNGFGPVHEHPDAQDWHALNTVIDTRQRDMFKARYLCEKQAHCVRALKLYENYVFGSDFSIELVPADAEDEPSEEEKKKYRKVSKQSQRVWEQVLEDNENGWSVEEYGRRCWRDGEQFTRVFEGEFPPKLRFIDPELIDTPSDEREDTQGIVTDHDDITTPLLYQKVKPDTRDLDELIPAEEVIHTKIDCDSNEKRGKTRFISVITAARLYEAFLENETTHRQAQASIVMVRKVAGRKGPSRAYDNASTSTTNYSEGPMSREKWRPGTIYTVGQDVDVSFAQPNANFNDATPLARLLLQYVAVATGFSYTMLTQDSSGGGYGSDLVQESPVLQMIKNEQNTLGKNLKKLFKRIIEMAIAAGELEGLNLETVWRDWDVNLKFYDPTSHDKLKDAQLANLKVISKVWSRAEAQRRDKVDPVRMQREISEEQEQDITDMSNSMVQGSNPDVDNMRQSSAQNGTAGGTNQGDNAKPIQHGDRVKSSS